MERTSVCFIFRHLSLSSSLLDPITWKMALICSVDIEVKLRSISSSLETASLNNSGEILDKLLLEIFSLVSLRFSWELILVTSSSSCSGVRQQFHRLTSSILQTASARLWELQRNKLFLLKIRVRSFNVGQLEILLNIWSACPEVIQVLSRSRVSSLQAAPERRDPVIPQSKFSLILRILSWDVLLWA